MDGEKIDVNGVVHEVGGDELEKENMDMDNFSDEKAIHSEEKQKDTQESQASESEIKLDKSDLLDDDKIELLVFEIEKMTKKLEEAEQSFARLSADFANFKKRTQREKADIYKYANEDLVKSILPALDDYDRAVSHYDESKAGPFGKGIDLVFKKLIEALKNKGVAEIESLNKEFDPNMHHAVAIDESDEHTKETVSEVLLKGYTLNGKVIRPSMVKVVK